MRVETASTQYVYSVHGHSPDDRVRSKLEKQGIKGPTYLCPRTSFCVMTCQMSCNVIIFEPTTIAIFVCL